MNLLYALERLRTPFWDAVFSAVTHLGEETVFMVAAILIFWCVSKEEGYYLLLMGFFGTVVNQFLKLLFRIPRPWVRDPDFTIVESARAQATGYSFPSGHTQNAVATFGGIARSTRRPWVRWTCVAVLLAVSFSRLYLGVHTPLDVGVSFAVAGVMVLALYPLIRQASRRPRLMAGLLAGMLLAGTADLRPGKRLEAAGGHGGLRHFLVAGPAVYPVRHPGRVVGAASEGGAGPCAADGHPGRAEGTLAGAAAQSRCGRGRALWHYGAVRRCTLACRVPLYGPLGAKGVI